MFRELDGRRSIFDLPAGAFAGADSRHDFTVRFHGRQASTPFGPAAGPHTQLAQNIVLAWLAGARVIELKTVQVHDRLTIPRPSIDVRTVGYNIEWSQELTLEESLEEYVKASMLIQMLIASGRLPALGHVDSTLFDMSVGYDLAGITSDRVRAFMAGMLDARAVIDRLRPQIPAPWRGLADVPFAPRVAQSVTLSTFHGCPPQEIERIAEFLLREIDLDVVLKLNPTLLGQDETNRLLHGVLGYGAIRVPAEAFARDLRWDAACDLVDRLGRTAASLGRSLGVKFCNTLVVENDGDFLPAEASEKYLSGLPLHVLAIQLVRRFRRRFGSRFPVSFSAGIDRLNFADAVALGLTPVTVCTDLLKTGGYSRGHKYLQELGRRMDGAGAATIGDFIIRARGLGAAALERLGVDADTLALAEQALAGGADLRAAVGGEVFVRWVAEASLQNVEQYADACAADPRYSEARNSRPPRKIGRELRMFDCVSCGKCVPVCPNDAIFTFAATPSAIDVVKVWHEPSGWHSRVEGSIPIREPLQFGTFADLCNDCGNCDVVCPEDGGPYRTKPRFFGTPASWRDAKAHDGFHVGRNGRRESVLGRFNGREYRMDVRRDRVLYSGEGFVLTFSEGDELTTLDGRAAGDVDLTYFFIMNQVRHGVLSSRAVNFINCSD